MDHKADYISHAEDTVATLTGNQFFNNSTGLWKSEIRDEWWPSANALEAIIDYMRLTGTEVKVKDPNTNEYTDIVSYVFKNNRSKDFANPYYDDRCWWAITWIKAYDLVTNKEKEKGEAYLHMAETIFEGVAKQWDANLKSEKIGKEELDSHCGGIPWSETKPETNTIENVLFLLIAARLYQGYPTERGGEYYKNWVDKTWSWFQVNKLIGSNYLVQNGLRKKEDKCCPNPTCQHYATYIQGVTIGALIEISTIPDYEDNNLLSLAASIANATLDTLADKKHILREKCEDNDNNLVPEKKDCEDYYKLPCDNDQMLFKGIFMRYWAELCTKLPDNRERKIFIDYIEENVDSIWDHNRKGKGDSLRFGLHWAGASEQELNPEGLFTQIPVLAAFNAAIKVTGRIGLAHRTAMPLTDKV